jgi:ribosomal protein S6--L-glutamate ligase
MHLTVLSRSAGIFTTRRIVEAARQRGHRTRVLDPLQVEMELGEAPVLYHRGRPFPRTDVVIPRIASSAMGHGVAVVNQLQVMGVPVLNGAAALSVARNKMRVLQLLSAGGVKVPHTVMAAEPSGLKDMVRLVGGLPVLVKLIRGNGRTGVIVCETRAALESALEAILRLGQNIVVQQYLRGVKGGDLRVLVVGGRVAATLRRRPRVGRLSRTLGQGARFEPGRLDAAAEGAALEAARVVGLEMCAVDLLDARGGPRVFEVNASPGIKEAEEICKVDVASLVVARAEELAAASGRASGARRRG